MTQNVAVTVDGVSKRFGKFEALRGVSFQVHKGGCVGIAGFNGAGKSTLLQIIAGTMQPTEGSVTTHGRVVALLELGAGFNPEFTGLENIYMSGALLGIPKSYLKKRLPEIEAFAEIGPFIHQPVKNYSSGMVVRLAFSMLTQVDPDVMIIDEALSVGDTYFSHKCARLIRKFRAEGKTFIFVSHDSNAVRTLADYVILLNQGTVERQGKPDAVLDYYNALIAIREQSSEIRQNEADDGRTLTRSGNQKTLVRTFEILDQSNSPARSFHRGDSVRVAVTVEFRSALSNPTFGVLIRDRIGNDVFGTNSFHLKKNLGDFAPGEVVEVSFLTRLTLGPGHYSVTVALHAGRDHLEENYDWFDQMIAFQILPGPEDYFIGCAALPADMIVSREPSIINRSYFWGERIDFSNVGNASKYKISGWSVAEPEYTWIDGSTADLEMNIEPSELDRSVRLSVRPYLPPEADSQTFSIIANDVLLTELEVSGDEIVSARLPASVLSQSGRLRLEIRVDKPVIPQTIGQGNDPRCLGIAIHWMSIR